MVDFEKYGREKRGAVHLSNALMYIQTCQTVPKGLFSCVLGGRLVQSFHDR